jgi:hypothetical protein
MAGVFGKDPHMKKSGGQEELTRISEERKRKQAEAATRFRLKKPVASVNSAAPVLKK